MQPDLRKLICEHIIRVLQHQKDVNQKQRICVKHDFVVQIQILHQKQKKASLKLEETRKQVEQQTKATQTLEKKISLRSNLYELYKNNLGFEIKPLKGGMNEEQSEIAFSFNHIDKNNPLETYSFILVLTEKTYSVKNCTPSLTEMERLLTELNKTNDLSSFVIQVRRNFMSLLTN
ncbi:uncharacterized protein TNCV_4634011 [Trichonephila clavipes]|nr:uncharacterized protein TNCV_4634011 [Trichonephila clavipes]